MAKKPQIAREPLRKKVLKTGQKRTAPLANCDINNPGFRSPQATAPHISWHADARHGGGGSDRKRKCADTIGTVLVPWAGHFQC